MKLKLNGMRNDTQLHINWNKSYGDIQELPVYFTIELDTLKIEERKKQGCHNYGNILNFNRATQSAARKS